jgi:hypothetical protein
MPVVHRPRVLRPLWINDAVDTGQRRTENLTLILSEHFRRSMNATDATLAQWALHAERLGGVVMIDLLLTDVILTGGISGRVQARMVRVALQ